MIKVFVYETLLSRSTTFKALGHRVKKRIPATLGGFKEVWISTDGERWPTLVPSPSVVAGEVVEVSEDDLNKLDQWEERYDRIQLNSSEGLVWVYIFDVVKTVNSF